MKKVLYTAVLAVFVMATGCKKSYTCTCKILDNGGSILGTYDSKTVADNADDAALRCDAMSSSSKSRKYHKGCYVSDVN